MSQVQEARTSRRFKDKVCHKCKKRGHVEINNCSVPTEVDTGASVSIMSETLYHKLWPRRGLKETNQAGLRAKRNKCKFLVPSGAKYTTLHVLVCMICLLNILKYSRKVLDVIDAQGLRPQPRQGVGSSAGSYAFSQM